MPKIAIVHFIKDEYYYSECIDKTIQHLNITDWLEVTKEELTLLRCYYRPGTNFAILEQQDNVKINQTIQVCLLEANKEKERQLKEKQQKEEAKRQRELKKLAKSEEQEKALLKQLAEKHPEVLNETK